MAQTNTAVEYHRVLVSDKRRIGRGILALVLLTPAASAAVSLSIAFEDADGDVLTANGRAMPYPSADILAFERQADFIAANTDCRCRRRRLASVPLPSLLL